MPTAPTRKSSISPTWVTSSIPRGLPMASFSPFPGAAPAAITTSTSWTSPPAASSNSPATPRAMSAPVGRPTAATSSSSPLVAVPARSGPCSPMVLSPTNSPSPATTNPPTGPPNDPARSIYALAATVHAACPRHGVCAWVLGSSSLCAPHPLRNAEGAPGSIFYLGLGFLLPFYVGCPRHEVCAWVFGSSSLRAPHPLRNAEGAPGSIFYLGLGFLLPFYVGCPRHEVCAWVLGLSSLRNNQLSSRPERPDLFLRAAFWCVGPRSAICAPRALRRGGGIAAQSPRLASLFAFRISLFE